METFGRIVALVDDVQPRDLWLDGPDGMIWTIGRTGPGEIVASRAAVSRRHARIVRDGPRYLLHDTASTNGTYVNGHRLTSPHLLADGDAIGLGDPAPLLRFVDPDKTNIAKVPTELAVEAAPVDLASERATDGGGAIRYDEAAMRFSLADRSLDLTPNEFRLLRLLWNRAGQVCTREECAVAVWGWDYVPGRDAGTLDRVVSNLRRKFRDLDANAEPIETRASLGYVLRR